MNETCLCIVRMMQVNKTWTEHVCSFHLVPLSKQGCWWKRVSAHITNSPRGLWSLVSSSSFDLTSRKMDEHGMVAQTVMPAKYPKKYFPVTCPFLRMLLTSNHASRIPYVGNVDLQWEKSGVSSWNEDSVKIQARRAKRMISVSVDAITLHFYSSSGHCTNNEWCEECRDYDSPILLRKPAPAFLSFQRTNTAVQPLVSTDQPSASATAWAFFWNCVWVQ